MTNAAREYDWEIAYKKVGNTGNFVAICNAIPPNQDGRFAPLQDRLLLLAPLENKREHP